MRNIVGYLGPEGTFTHQAAVDLGTVGVQEAAVGPIHEFIPQTTELKPYTTVPEIFAALANGEIDSGVAAIDNTVEGPVFATIDGLLSHPDIVAASGKWLPIQFDAYVLVNNTESQYQFGVAHSHALAQVGGALKRYGVTPLAASSNGAALAELKPGQIAFGPPGYMRNGVKTLAHYVGDYDDAKTLFVRLERPPQLYRKYGGWDPADIPATNQATMLAIWPGGTGPGVLARITAEFANNGLNLSALFSRPIKGQAGQYVFIVTVDAPPWGTGLAAAVAAMQQAGDTVRAIGTWDNKAGLR